MMYTIKKAFCKKSSLKIISVIISYSLWLLTSRNNIITKIINTPLYFYNTNNSLNIIAPQKIKIKLIGLKKDISSLNTKELSTFIDAKNFTYGTYPLIIDYNNLFLPSNIKVETLEPLNTFIKIK